MNKIFFFIILFILLISCNKDFVKKTEVKPEKKLITVKNSIPEINFDSIVKSNSNSFVFMNFYPNIKDDVFYYLAEKYVSKGKFKKKKEEYYYTINNYDYLIEHKYPDYILLFKKVSHTTSKKVYKKNITDLINVFKKKYGKVKIKKGKNSVPFSRSTIWKSTIWETFTFSNKHKIINITGHQTNNLSDYEKSDQENLKTFNNYDNYKIFIEFFTLKSFEDKKDRVKKYEKIKQKLKIEASKNEHLEKEKNEKELMKDI